MPHPEIFTYAANINNKAKLATLPQGEYLPLVVERAKGHLAMSAAKVPTAEGTPKDVVSGKIEGTLLSATFLLELQDKSGESRFVLLQRDAGAPSYAGHWQIPAGRMSPGETATSCAAREFMEEVKVEGLSYKGQSLQLSEKMLEQLADKKEGAQITWDSGKTEIAPYVFFDNTVEFFKKAVVKVDDFSSVKLSDNEGWGRNVALLTRGELNKALDNICPSSKLIWEAHQVHTLKNNLAKEGYTTDSKNLLESIRNPDDVKIRATNSAGKTVELHLDRKTLEAASLRDGVAFKAEKENAYKPPETGRER